MSKDKVADTTKWEVVIEDVDNNWSIQTSDNDGRTIAQNNIEEEVNLKEAYLIAEAPAMLEALKHIADITCDHGPQEFCQREIALRAISRIEGGQSE